MLARVVIVPALNVPLCVDDFGAMDVPTVATRFGPPPANVVAKVRTGGVVGGTGVGGIGVGGTGIGAGALLDPVTSDQVGRPATRSKDPFAAPVVVFAVRYPSG